MTDRMYTYIIITLAVNHRLSVPRIQGWGRIFVRHEVVLVGHIIS